LNQYPADEGLDRYRQAYDTIQGKKSGLIGLTVVLNFQTEAMAHEPKSHGLRPVRYAPIPPFLLTRAAVPGLRNLQKTAQWACFLAAARLRLSTRLDSL